MNINFIEELGKAIEKTLSKPQNINGIENEEIELAQKLDAIEEYTIDRFEEDMVVIEDRKTGKMKNIEKEKLKKSISKDMRNFQKYFEIDINSQNQQATEIKSTSVSSENGIKNIVIGSGDINNENNLHVYYIDVGQADSILIMNENQSILIDAGNNEDGDWVVNFIKNKGITKLDYVIGTHPHEDHIGGMDDVINNIDIDKIYLPPIQTNTKTYQDVLQAIKDKNKKISSLKKGDKFSVGEAEFEVMTDSILDKSNLNLSSNIIKMDFNGTSFLFTGDAESENEKSITWGPIDVLKVRTSWFNN